MELHYVLDDMEAEKENALSVLRMELETRALENAGNGVNATDVEMSLEHYKKLLEERQKERNEARSWFASIMRSVMPKLRWLTSIMRSVVPKLRSRI